MYTLFLDSHTGRLEAAELYTYQNKAVLCTAVSEIGNRPCLQHIPSRIWNLLRRLEHRLAGRMNLQQILERSIREQHGAGGNQCNQSPGRGECGGDSPQKSMPFMHGAGRPHGIRYSSAYSTSREANIDAAITQIALDIKQHRDVEKGRDPSSRGVSAHPTPREANIDARSNHDARSELERAASHELDLKYMVSAISADAALLSQRAAQVSSLLSPRSQDQVHGGGRGGEEITRDERKPPRPPRISQQEREFQQKSALKHTQSNNHSQPHSTSLIQALAYASPSAVISSPRSNVNFKGKTPHMFVQVCIHVMMKVDGESCSMPQVKL